MENYIPFGLLACVVIFGLYKFITARLGGSSESSGSGVRGGRDSYPGDKK